MADRKITDLTALAAGSQATGDLLTIVDVSEGAATDKNKKMTMENLFKGIPGDVGIGTSSPSQLLHLQSSDPSVQITRTGSHVARISAPSGGGLSIGADGSDGSTVRFRIDNSGNVGIGTTSPSGKLDIVTGTTGNVLIDAEGGSNFHAKIVNDSGDLVVGSRQTSADTIFTSQRRTLFKTGSSETERMRIDSSGSVGIGTSSPGVPLHVYHATTNGVARFESGDANALITFKDSATTDNPSVGAKGDNYVVITASTERMRIDSSGNVGIGTTSPQAITGYTVLTLNNATQGGVIEFKNNDTSYGRLLQGSTSVILETKQAIPLIFNTNNTEEMRLLSGGGLTFNGDTAQANALDDYEEGLHTITTNSNLTSSTNYRQWYYTKIGRKVTISGLLRVSSVSSTDNVSVSLPFAAAANPTNGASSYTGQVMHYNVQTEDNGLAWFIAGSTSEIRMYQLADNGPWSRLNNGDLAANDELYMTCTYFTS